MRKCVICGIWGCGEKCIDDITIKTGLNLPEFIKHFETIFPNCIISGQISGKIAKAVWKFGNDNWDKGKKWQPTYED